MAEAGSFWSTVPGLLTGLAGVLTAVVTLATLAVSQGWVGDGGSGEAATDEEAEAGAPAAETSTTAPEIELVVEPATVRFRPAVLGAVTEKVTLTNNGAGPLDVDPPQLVGDDTDGFEVEPGDCARASLGSGRSCTMSVTFKPNGISRAEARLVVSVNGEARSEEIPLVVAVGVR